MSARLAPRDLALILVVVALWGFAFVPIRWALDALPPFSLAALRFLFAALPAVLFVRRPAVSWTALVAYGAAIGIWQFGLLFLGMQLGMPAGLSSLVIQMQVFFTMALGVLWMRDRLGVHNVAGAIVAASGVAVLGVHRIAAGATTSLIGFALVIAAALGWAVGNVMAKRMMHGRDDEMLGLVVWSSLVPPLPLFAVSWLFEGGPAALHAVVDMSARTLGCILLLAYGATLFGYVSWNRLLHRYPTPLVSPFGLLIPVSGLASGALFLGERLAPLQAVGAALVLAGLAWNVYGPRSRRAPTKTGAAPRSS
jgi:O-acetylserine/cysteine efflux transporter